MLQLFIALTQNAALLVALSVLYSLLSKFKQNRTKYSILVGVLFGAIAIAGMNIPVYYEPGIIYDARSVVLVLSGLFGGGIASLVAVLMAGTFRFFLGGVGVMTGLITIPICAIIGLIVRKMCHDKPENISLFNLWLLGLLSHIIMLSLQLLLPWPSGLDIIMRLWAPILTIFPIATLIAGMLLQTEEKRLNALSKIKSTEKRFQALSEHSPVGIFRTLPNGYTTYVNPRWSQLSGISKEQAIGDGWLQAVHPDDRNNLEKRWKEIALNEGRSLAEYRFLRQDGEVISVYGEAVPEFGEDGKLVGYIGTLTNITQRKEAQEALRENEQNYRNLFENDPAIKIMVDPDSGEIVSANKAAANFYGWSVEQLVEMTIEQIEQSYQTITHPNRGQNSHTQKAKHRLANGEIRTVELFINQIRFQGKDCCHCIIHDITEKQQAEEKLKLLSKALEQSPVSVTIVNPRGKIEYVNPKFTEISGFTPEEVIGEKLYKLNPNQFSSEVYKHILQTISSGQDWVGESENRRKNGEAYWESQIISPIVDTNGKITNFISVREDITEQKRMLKEVVEAKEKAEKAERLKSAFLANMSHEIRTPLNAILGFTNMLTSNANLSQESREEYVFIINKSAEGLLQIINDILDISKLETGLVKIFKKPFELEQVLESLKARYIKKLAYENKLHIKLHLEIAQSVPELDNDETRLVQIFTNLLDNAVKFTEEGEIAFGISRATAERIDFFVSDTGIGIAEKDQTNIFERFRQAGESTARLQSGNGLGLAIVKNLAKLMGGNITLQSKKGVGTTFHFWIPR